MELGSQMIIIKIKYILKSVNLIAKWQVQALLKQSVKLQCCQHKQLIKNLT